MYFLRTVKNDLPPVLCPEKIQELHALLSVPMVDFDCGTLCAPANKGIPLCCDHQEVVPLIFRDEFAWLRGQSDYWKPMPVITAEDRKLLEDSESDYDVLAVCGGPAGCDRSRRALVCRTYPFEPHCDTKGNILGMAFIYANDHHCPLIDRQGVRYNPQYIANSIAYWEEIFDLFPEEKELYTFESRRVRRRFKRKGRAVPLFTPERTIAGQ
jgi:hypothetical protein